MKTKTLSDNIFKWGTFKNSAIPTYEVKEFIKWCLDNNINQTGKTLVLL